MLVPVGPFRKVPCGGGVLPNIINPRSLPGLELDLESWLGLTGAHNSVVQPWPDQSGHGRDAGNDVSFGNDGTMKLQTTSNLTPSGRQTVYFNGRDYPHAAVGLNAQPNPWPVITNGYTFYSVFNQLNAVSSSTIELLFNEGTANFRWVNGGVGFDWGYRDNAGTDRVSNTASFNGWQASRLLIRAAGTVDNYVNNVRSTWQGGWNQQWTITPNILAGYTVGNLATNYVVGSQMLVGGLLWFSREHTPFQQQGIENYLRFLAGLPLLLGAP